MKPSTKVRIKKLLKPLVEQILKESSMNLNQLEDYFYKNERKIRQNMKTYGIDDVSEIRSYVDLASVLGLDSRLFKSVAVDEYASYLNGLINQE